MRRHTLHIILLLCVAALTATAKSQQFTLVIDAGHGGHDAGAIGQITKEKTINLNVALALGRLIEQNCHDVKVVYTRKTDIFIPLQERANIANKAGADLFISVHTNSLPAGRIARGFETYTLGMHRAKDNLDVAMRENSVISLEKDYKQRYQGFDPKSSESYIMFEFMQSANMEKSVELAKIIQRTVCNTVGRNNKGVHQAGFLVLRATSMPSCLIELGFISTPDEEAFLNSDDGVNAMANGIYKAFVEYKNKYSDKVVVPYAAPKKQTLETVGHVLPQNIETRTNDKKDDKKKQNEKKKQNNSTPKTKAPATTPAPQNTSTPKQSTTKSSDGIVFKVQIFAVNRTLRPGSQQFKGHKDVDCYQEGSQMKYTIGSSSDYSSIVALRKKLLDDFPEAFIVAFKNGERIDVNKARTETQQKKNK